MAHTTPPAFSTVEHAEAKALAIDLSNVDWDWVASIFELFAKLIRGAFGTTPMSLAPADAACAQRLGIDPAHLDLSKWWSRLKFLLDLLSKFGGAKAQVAPIPAPKS